MAIGFCLLTPILEACNHGNLPDVRECLEEGVDDNAHKYFTITPNVNYKCRGSVAAIALPVAAIALPQPPIYLKLT